MQIIFSAMILILTILMIPMHFQKWYEWYVMRDVEAKFCSLSNTSGIERLSSLGLMIGFGSLFLNDVNIQLSGLISITAYGALRLCYYCYETKYNRAIWLFSLITTDITILSMIFSLYKYFKVAI